MKTGVIVPTVEVLWPDLLIANKRECRWKNTYCTLFLLKFLAFCSGMILGAKTLSLPFQLSRLDQDTCRQETDEDPKGNSIAQYQPGRDPAGNTVGAYPDGH